MMKKKEYFPTGSIVQTQRRKIMIKNLERERNEPEKMCNKTKGLVLLHCLQEIHYTLCGQGHLWLSHFPASCSCTPFV